MDEKIDDGMKQVQPARIQPVIYQLSVTIDYGTPNFENDINEAVLTAIRNKIQSIKFVFKNNRQKPARYNPSLKILKHLPGRKVSIEVSD